jgi:hypothetical protein
MTSDDKLAQTTTNEVKLVQLLGWIKLWKLIQLPFR